MKFQNFEDLIKNIEKDLGSEFKQNFRESRKRMAGLKKLPNSTIFSEFDNLKSEWVFNWGGKKEIQYHIYFRNQEIGYGLGINSQRGSFNNDDPAEIANSFGSSFIELYNEILTELPSYTFVIGSKEDLGKMQEGEFLLFGNTLPVGTNNHLEDADYQDLIINLKKQLKIYCEVFELTNFKKAQNFQKEKQMEELKEKVDILRYKKQIILQGPPGTGKTRQAKGIAHLILNGNPENLAPLQLIENFFKSGISDSYYNLKFKERLAEFQEAFPKNQLANLELDDYCIGKGNNTNFCWWIEVGLKEFGRFSPGNSGNYTIYFSKSQDDYVLTKMEGSPKEVLPQLANALQDLAEKENIEEAEKFFGYSFIIKILNSYYPEKYFPINGRDSLINLMKLFSEDFKKIGTIDLNKKIQQIFTDYKNRFPSDITNLDFMKFLYSRFDLNNDGNLYEKTTELISKRKPTIIQFHPSYTYEDFVRGIVAESNGKNIEYKSVNKIIGKLAIEASENPYADYVLIIDEINRANLSSVLGELIYALEYRNEIVMSPYGILDDNNDEKENYELLLPTNLYIIGTMNTADRSVGHIDYAIRRRFAFVDVLPEELDDNKIVFQKDLFKEVSALFINNYDAYNSDKNTKLERAKTLSGEFRPEDIWLGHSYFIQTKELDKDGKEILVPEDFDVRLEYEIKPILLEYVKDGILIDGVLDVNKISVEDRIRNLSIK